MDHYIDIGGYFYAKLRDTFKRKWRQARGGGGAERKGGGLRTSKEQVSIPNPPTFSQANIRDWIVCRLYEDGHCVHIQHVQTAELFILRTKHHDVNFRNCL